MPPKQDKTSSGKKVDKSTPTTNCVLLVQRIYAIDLAHDATVGERSRNSKIFLRNTKIYLWRDQQRVEGGVHLHTLVDR